MLIEFLFKAILIAELFSFSTNLKSIFPSKVSTLSKNKNFKSESGPTTVSKVSGLSITPSSSLSAKQTLISFEL